MEPLILDSHKDQEQESESIRSYALWASDSWPLWPLIAVGSQPKSL
jgi:hypothetical protein